MRPAKAKVIITQKKKEPVTHINYWMCESLKYRKKCYIVDTHVCKL